MAERRTAAGGIVLLCDGAREPDCPHPVTHIDRKWYIYCQRHALRGRKLKPAELARLQSGGTAGAVLMAEDKPGWVKAAVGCYWSKGEYHACSVSGGGQPPGYAVYRDRQCIGRRLTWAEVEALVRFAEGERA